MAESTGSTAPQPPENDMHWGFSYLREDIQDIRLEFRGQLHEVQVERDGRQVAASERRLAVGFPPGDTFLRHHGLIPMGRAIRMQQRLRIVLRDSRRQEHTRCQDTCDYRKTMM